jgi:hypothetical protein
VGADAEHHVAQVFDGIDVVGLAAGDESVETRDVLVFWLSVNVTVGVGS